MYEPTDVVTDEAEIRAGFAPVHSAQRGKILDHIDATCRAWIEASPFAAIATVDAAGRVDVSPRGDPPGFAKVLDPHSLAVPDRPGNHRFDTISNVLATRRAGMVFLVKSRNEVVRVNGSARVVRDPPLLESMAIKGRRPALAILIRVEEAFWHCGKAVIRSGLWDMSDAPAKGALPTYAEALAAQGAGDLGVLEARFADNDARRLYEE